MTLPALVGHSAVQQQLVSLAAEGRFPHAVLLHGPQGVGKRLIAETIGRYLLCGGSSMNGRLLVNESNPVYAQIEAGACADYVVLEKLDGSASIKVEQVRALLEKLALSSHGKRVVIVDAADDLGEEAANALLKTLEEPGRNLHFMLVTHNLFRLLPTIISRCRKVPVAGLSQDETLQVLQRQSEVDAVTAAQLAEQNPFSPGQALHLGPAGLALQQELAAVFNGETTPAALADMAQQRRQVDEVLSLLLQQVARQRTPQAADVYQQLQILAQRRASHNLTGAWVLEEALTLAQKTCSA